MRFQGLVRFQDHPYAMKPCRRDPPTLRARFRRRATPLAAAFHEDTQKIPRLLPFWSCHCCAYRRLPKSAHPRENEYNRSSAHQNRSVGTTPPIDAQCNPKTASRRHRRTTARHYFSTCRKFLQKLALSLSKGRTLSAPQVLDVYLQTADLGKQ